MKDKFRENFWIAFPAAVMTLVVILVLSFSDRYYRAYQSGLSSASGVPYVLVLIGGIIGINVFVVLLLELFQEQSSCLQEDISLRWNF